MSAAILSPLSSVDRDRLRIAVEMTSLRRQAIVAGVTLETIRRALDGGRIQREVRHRILSALDSVDTDKSTGRAISVRVVDRTETENIDLSMVEVCCEGLEAAVGASVVSVGSRGECYIASAGKNATVRWWRISHCPWCGEKRPC